VGASALALLVCGLIAGLSTRTLATLGSQVSAATARGHGEVIRTDGHTVQIRWPAPDEQRTATVVLATSPPPVGTHTEVAYDPRAPRTVFIPGSAELAAVDRAASGLTFSALIGAGVLATLGWQLITRYRLHRRPAQPAMVRRVRVQSGLLTRSWLELDSAAAQRWIPVHFDPVLATLPAPASVELHGDPYRHRLVAAEVDGIWLHPSGPVRASEPRGRRIDSPAHPDAEALADGAGYRHLWTRQWGADAALLTPAPLVGLLWAFLDGGGVRTWAGATALAAALALCWAALRGSDPT
jgi:hypothetical protein